MGKTGVFIGAAQAPVMFSKDSFENSEKKKNKKVMLTFFFFFWSLNTNLPLIFLCGYMFFGRSCIRILLSVLYISSHRKIERIPFQEIVFPNMSVNG